MTVPTISNLPTVPATSDPNFETEAPALFNHIKNTFVSEMNSAISFINSSTFDATVEFKNASFTAAKNFLYMIDTTGGAVTVTLPASPATGDQLLLMDQKRSFGTNNLTIGRNSQNINGAASNVVSKSTGALIRCIFQSSYGWTVDLYEGQWESGYTAGDLVYTGGNVGIGTTAPATTSNLEIMDSVNPTIRINRDDSTLGEGDIIGTFEFNQKDPSTPGAGVVGKIQSINESASIGKAGLSFSTGDQSTLTERVRIDADGNVGIGTSSPSAKLEVESPSGAGNTNLFRLIRDGGYGDTTFNQWYTDGAGTPSGSNPTALYGLNMGLVVGSANNGKVAVRLESQGGSNTIDDSIVFRTANSDKVFIKSSGKVGIGTSEPDFEFHVKKDQNATTTLALHNLDTGTSANAQFYVETDHGAGDPLIQFKVQGVQAFMVGIDNSDSDKFKISDSGHSLGTNDRLVIDSSGNVEVSTGNLVIGTAGKGIDFSANSHATGMSSELLDDYEEGTFTPSYETSSGSFTSIIYNRRTGNYTKIGNIVHVLIDISTDELTLGTASGNVRISGLPFTVTNHSSGTMTAQNQWTTNAPSHVYVAISTTQLWLRFLSGANYSDITTSNLKTGTNTDANRLMGISFSYKTS